MKQQRDIINRLSNNLKDITKIANKRGMQQQDFLEAAIKFFIIHDAKFSIVNGNIEFRKDFVELKEL